MKEISKKMIAVLVIMLMLINSSLLTVLSIAVDAIEEAIEQKKIKAMAEIGLEKYVNYSFGDNKGVLLKLDLKTGIEYGENQEYKPLKSSTVDLVAPQINGEYPENVELQAISTKATNGEEKAKDFTYNYDSQNGHITIQVENKEDDNGNIYTVQDLDARDNYKIDLYYSANCYDYVKSLRDLDLNGEIVEVIANEDGTEIRDRFEEKLQVSENISGLVSTDIETSEIYNGYIKANAQNETSYQTEYTENMKVNIDYKEIADEIELVENNKFINTQNDEVETNDIIYKNTKVNKNEILDILGNDGYLQIITKTDDEEKVLLNINKDTEAAEDGSVFVNYEEELTELRIRTSKPIKVGTISFTNEKIIKETMTNLDNNKIKTEIKIAAIKNVVEETEEQETQGTQATQEAQEVQGEQETETKENEEKITKQEIYSYEENKEFELINSETNAKLSVDKKEWTNNVQNDVKFTVELVTNNIKYNLYKNPVIEIVLPQEVERVDLGTVSPLYEKNFSIVSAKPIQSGENKVIRVELEGIQSEYTTSDIYSGPEILIPATIFIKKDISSITTNMTLNCSNGNDNNQEQYSENVEISIDSNYQDTLENNENGLLQAVALLQELSDNSTQETLQEEQEVYQDESNLQTSIKMMVGNKNLQNGEVIHEDEYIQYIIDLKNNSDSAMQNINFVGKVPEGSTYVEYKIVDKLSDEDIEYALYDRTKMIEHSDKKEYTETVNLNAGEEKQIIYYARINGLNSDVTEQDLNTEIKVGNYTFTQVNKIKKAEMSVKVFAWETERDNNLWRYGITLTNKTEQDINNLKLDVNLPEGLVYEYNEEEGCTVTEENGTVHIEFSSEETLKGNAEKTIYLYIKAYGDENTSEFYATVLAKAYGDNTDEYYSNLNIEKIFNVTVEIHQTSEKEGKTLQRDEEIEYIYTIKNTSNKDIINNIVGIELIEFADENLDLISAEYESFELNNETGKYEKVVFTRDLSYKSVPSDVENPDEYPDIDLTATILAGEEIYIKIKAKAGLVSFNTEISNSANITYEYNGVYTKKSNIIKNIIAAYGNFEDPGTDEPGTDEPGTDEPGTDEPGIDEPGTDEPGTDEPGTDEPGTDDSGTDDPGTNDNTKTYSISGFVWNDSDKNGERGIDEEIFENIVVKLVDENNNSIIQKTTTDQSGVYQFNNISSGKYLVLFEYDYNKYSITTYQKQGVNERRNSDVILKEVSINGEIEYAGVSDVIILNKDYTNIDMGLIEKVNFDLSINKSITKVTATYGNKTKEYSFKDSKLAKVEIPSKNINGAKVVVEYKIEVTNEGNMAGTADEIVDFIPEEFEFDSKLNNGWYESGNGMLKNVALQGMKIESGSSKTIYLYLTKTLTPDSIGTSVNNVEIYKSSSINGDKDIDSTNANNKQDEDDFSKAELIISVKTGALLYTSIVLGIILVLLGIKLLIDKKIITLKRIKTLSTILVFSSIIGITISTQAFTAADAKQNEINNFEPSSRNPKYCYYYDGTSTWYDFKGVSSGNPYLTYNYIHHGASSSKQGLKKSEGDLYCTEGGDMANGAPGWKYEYNSHSDITIGGMNKTVDGSVAKITGKDSEAQISASGHYYLVGPYTVTYTGDISGIEVYGIVGNREVKLGTSKYKITNNSGTEKNISSGTKFYIKYSTNDVQYITKIKITVRSSATANYSYNVSYTEYWKTSGHSGAQILGKNINKGVFKTETESTTASVRLSAPHPKRAYLTIEKIDGTTGSIIYNPTKIRLTSNEGSEDITISGTYRRIVTPGTTYTVEEIEAPSGYNLALQPNYSNAVTSGTVTVPTSSATSTIEVKITLVNVKPKPAYLTIEKRDAITGNIIYNPTTITLTSIEGSQDITISGTYRKEVTPGIRYKVEEKVAPSGYLLSVQKNDNRAVWSGEVDMPMDSLTDTIETSITLKNIMYPTLNITKVDKDTGSALTGAGFTIRNNNTGWYVYEDASGNAAYSNDAVTVNMGNSSRLDITNIMPGNYTITETVAPNGYNLDVQEAADKVKTIDIGLLGINNLYPNTVNVKFENRRYGILKIEKVDKESDNLMGGVGFKIISTVDKPGSYSAGQYMQVYKGGNFLTAVDGKVSIARGETQYSNGEHYYDGWTGDPNAATIFYTNQIGEVIIENVIQANYKAVESAFKEVSGINLGNYYDLSTEEYEVEVRAYDKGSDGLLTEVGREAATKDATYSMLKLMEKENISKYTYDNANIEELYYYYIKGDKIFDSIKTDEIYDKYIIDFLKVVAREYKQIGKSFKDYIYEVILGRCNNDEDYGRINQNRERYWREINEEIGRSIEEESRNIYNYVRNIDSMDKIKFMEKLFEKYKILRVDPEKNNFLIKADYGTYEISDTRFEINGDMPDEVMSFISQLDFKKFSATNREYNLQNEENYVYYLGTQFGVRYLRNENGRNFVIIDENRRVRYTFTYERYNEISLTLVGVNIPNARSNGYSEMDGGYKFTMNKGGLIYYNRSYNYHLVDFRENDSLGNISDGEEFDSYYNSPYAFLTNMYFERYINNILYNNRDQLIKDRTSTYEGRREYIKNVYRISSVREAKESEIYVYNMWIEKGEVVLRVLNEQKYVDIAGYAWQDNGFNKYQVSGTSNGYYSDSEDKKIKGIWVELIDKNSGNRIQGPIQTDESGAYKFTRITLERDSNGNVTNLQNLAIRFTYDGFRYSTVDIINLGQANTSKAQELTNSRQNMNNKFQNVSSGKVSGNVGNITLNYDIEEDGKKARYKNEIWNYDDSGTIVKSERKSALYDTVATTSETGYTITRGASGIEQYIISNVNLGLFNREQVDGMIYSNDVDNVKIQINGHESTYEYGKSSTVTTDAIAAGTQAVKVSSYRRAIYPSYVRAINDMGDKKLRVFVTYKVVLANSSNTLRLRINELTSYYDSKYDENSIFVSDDKNNFNTGKYRVATSSEDDHGYKRVVINSNDGNGICTMNARETHTIYMQFEVKTSALANIFNGEQTCDTISEISSFTTFYGNNTKDGSRIYKDNNTVYAAIDYNSAPGNAKPTNVNFENDTNVSPKLAIYEGTEKIISGNVFEDLGFEKSEDNNLHTGQDRLGDGIFDKDNESYLEDVLVQLVPVYTQEERTPNYNGVAYIYPNEYHDYIGGIDTDSNNRAVAAMYTNSRGEYSFNGVVPGTYKIRFTYGENVVYEVENIREDRASKIVDEDEKINVKLQDYKSTIRTGDFYNTPYWYLNKTDMYSDALDDWNKRQNIDEHYGEDITNGTVVNYGTEEDYYLYSSIAADTDNMCIEVENTADKVIDGDTVLSGEINNINFGIIKRPKHEVRLTKDIERFSIILANGQALVDGNPARDHLNYVTYPAQYGPLKVEIDNEIIEGAKVEITYAIKVENLSEIDYHNEAYYKYGKNGENYTQNPSTETITRVIDYLDNDLAGNYNGYSTTAAKGDWYKLSENDINHLCEQKIITEEIKNTQGKEFRTILMIEDPEGLKNIAVGETGIERLKASKLLTTIVDDCVFENYTEILGESNASGKFMNSSTPGNYVISNETNTQIEPDSNERCSNLAKVVIIPPTGQQRIYYAVGISALAILVVGIILIKKKVLDA